MIISLGPPLGIFHSWGWAVACDYRTKDSLLECELFTSRIAAAWAKEWAGDLDSTGCPGFGTIDAPVAVGASIPPSNIVWPALFVQF